MTTPHLVRVRSGLTGEPATRLANALNKAGYPAEIEDLPRGVGYPGAEKAEYAVCILVKDDFTIIGVAATWAAGYLASNEGREELLAACEAVLPAIRWGMVHQPGNMNQWADCVDLLNSAIAKAKGANQHERL